MSDLDAFYHLGEQVFSDTVSPQVIEATERRELPDALFDALSETGMLSMLAPEQSGGIGAHLNSAVAVLRAAGAAAAPGPVLETMLSRFILARAELPPTQGWTTFAFADEDNAPPGSGRWLRPPDFRHVPWGEAAENFVVVSPQSCGGIRVAASRTSDWNLKPGLDAAGEPLDHLSGSEIVIACQGVPDIGYEEVLHMASLLRGGQILGAVEWVFRRSTEYAMERKQFGREIGKFQAVQQMLAELAGHTLGAAAITQAAADAGSPTLVASARSRLADAADAAITIGHQVHGALGFSREYALNHRTRRLISWRDDYGSVAYWRQQLARQFVGLDRTSFWPAVTGSGTAVPAAGSAHGT